VKAIARALEVSRSNLYEKPVGVRTKRSPTDDAEALASLQEVVGIRCTYGYRRAAAMVNRARKAAGQKPINHKRAYRLLKENGLLLPRYVGHTEKRHEGQVVTLKSDLRWCSDGFEFRCWDGSKVHVVFSLDCCDREVIAYEASTSYPTGQTVRNVMAATVEARFGKSKTVPHPLEWLSDNGPQFIADETRHFGKSLGLTVCNTPSYSPESNGMAEAFVKTFKRDYVYVNELRSAESVLALLPGWFEDYNSVHPHKGLKMMSPREFRSQTSQGQGGTAPHPKLAFAAHMPNTEVDLSRLPTDFQANAV